MFVGYPRSGHSLAGSLLDAHPEAVISHELDALRYLRAGFSRPQVYALILENDRRFTEEGRQAKVDYGYAVPDQWQGRFRRLRVVGDKKGGHSTSILRRHPHTLDLVRSKVGCPLRVIHVMRNPYDNIATMLARSSKWTLPDAVSAYFWLCEGVAAVRTRLTAEELLDLRHEDLLEDTPRALGRLCGFLGLEGSPDYVAACASVIRPSPHLSRERAPWNQALIDDVGSRAAAFDFLRGYSFEASPMSTATRSENGEEHQEPR